MTTFKTRSEAKKELTNVAKERALNYMKSEIAQCGKDIFTMNLLTIFRLESECYANNMMVCFNAEAQAYEIRG